MNHCAWAKLTFEDQKRQLRKGKDKKKRKEPYREKMCANYIFDKGLLSRIYLCNICVCISMPIFFEVESGSVTQAGVQ